VDLQVASAIQLELQDYYVDKENRLVLKPFGFLTRDSRIKEQEIWFKKSAKSPQFSKR
jgi:ribosomal protein S9